MRTFNCVFFELVVLAFSFAWCPAANAAPRQYLYWSDFNFIKRSDVDGGNITTILADPRANPAGLALDPVGLKIYWTDPNQNHIRRANLNGSGAETIVTAGLSIPNEIELDLNTGKVYWTDSGTGKVQRANFDGTSVEDLITNGLIQPTGIAIDSAGQQLFVANGDGGDIRRSSLDGTNVEIIVPDLGPFVLDIDVDITAAKIYWTVFSNPGSIGKIQRANFDGTDVEDVINFGGDTQVFPNSIALDGVNGKLYWTDGLHQRLRGSNLDGSNATDIVSGLHLPLSIELLTIPEPTALALLVLGTLGILAGRR